MRFLNVAMCVGRGARGKRLYAIFLEKKLKNNFLRVSNQPALALIGRRLSLGKAVKKRLDSPSDPML